MSTRGSRGGGRGRPRGARGGAAAPSTTRASQGEADAPLGVASANAVPSSSTSEAVMQNPPAQAGPSANLGQSATPVAPARGGSRFRPKNIRRDAAERQRLEDARNRELAAIIKVEEREMRMEERRAMRGRGRGRGDFFAQRGLIRRVVTATGPFSAIASENVKAAAARSSGWTGRSDSGGASTRVPLAKGEGSSQNQTRYLPRREHENRVNIDLFTGLTDGHEEDGTPLYLPKRYEVESSSNPPVGLRRTQHKDPEVKVKTNAELEAEDRQLSDEDDGDLFVEILAKGTGDIEMSDDNEVWHAAPKSRIVAQENKTEDFDKMDVDTIDGVRIKTPPSPEAKKKQLGDGDGTATERLATEQRKLKEKRVQDPEVQFSAWNIETLLRQLSFSSPADDQEGQGKDDRLFLFQLPPVLPPLEDPTPESDAVTEIANPALNEDNGEPRVKLEEEGTEPPPPISQNGFPAQGGFVGKLNVRKSGKVELDWGGTPLKVGSGIEHEMLTTAMIVEQDNVKVGADQVARNGVACGMGRIFGSFVLMPIWDDESDWDPSLSDLGLVDNNQETGASLQGGSNVDARKIPAGPGRKSSDDAS